MLFKLPQKYLNSKHAMYRYMGLKPWEKFEDRDFEIINIETAPETMGMVEIIKRKEFMTESIRITNF